MVYDIIPLSAASNVSIPDRLNGTIEGKHNVGVRFLSRHKLGALIFGFILSSLVMLFFFQRSRQSEDAYKARLVLLYVPCTINKALLEPYNPRVRYTPYLRRFAEGAVVFQRHQTQETFSGGAYASLFTGTSHDRHGIYYHPARMKETSYLIAESFRDNGYETFFWTSHTLASPELNYAQGVPSGNIFPGPQFDPRSLTTKDKTFRSILQKLKTDPKYKVFIQVNFSLTHAPYTKSSPPQATLAFCEEYPEECWGITPAELMRYAEVYSQNHIGISFRFKETSESLHLQPMDEEKLTRTVQIVYKSCLNRLDQRFGQTLAMMQDEGVLEESLIIYTSDHGEIMGRKEAPIRWGHGHLEPEVLEIPLIIRLPEKLPSKVFYRQITRAIDVFPTIAGLLKISIPKTEPIDGLDLSSAIFNLKKAPKLISYSCNELPHPAIGKDDPAELEVARRSLDSYHKISSVNAGSRFFLFDPKEQHWVAGRANTANNREIKEQLRRQRDQLVRSYERSNDRSDWDDVREKLRSLGYIQ